MTRAIIIVSCLAACGGAGLVGSRGLTASDTWPASGSDDDAVVMGGMRDLPGSWVLCRYHWRG